MTGSISAALIAFLPRSISAPPCGSSTRDRLPYKAVLKSVLMEAYSHEYPNTRLLSVTSRDWFQHNEGMHCLDNYCLMLDKVTNYLSPSATCSASIWCVAASI